MGVTAADIGLLMLRLGLSAILFAHATQKLFGWFGGSGFAASVTLLETLGQRPGKVMVRLAAGCETTAAITLLFGFLAPVGSAIGIGTMLVAGSSLAILKHTFWNAVGGGEYPYFLAWTMAALAFTGPGRIAVDASLTLPLHDRPILVGLLAVLVGVLAALPTIQRTRRNQVMTTT